MFEITKIKWAITAAAVDAGLSKRQQDEFLKEIRSSGGALSIVEARAGLRQGVLRDPNEAAKAMQAMRNIVEMTSFQNMRPVASNGDDFDSLVTQGPAPNWQVIADEGRDYIVYFWGERSTNSAQIDLPAGKYEYSWMETRTKKRALKSGSINMEESGLTAIESPPISTWRQSSGIVLVIVNQAGS